ncbi:MAG: hypothetical protein ACOH18_00065 [Candidatus Saccharimonadaceae bacterium]
MNNKDDYYRIGEIINPLPVQYQSEPIFKTCTVKVGARLSTFLCHHDFFSNPPRPQVYPVNSINFTVNEFTEVFVECTSGTTIVINASEKEKDILMHTALMLKTALGFSNGLNITGKVLHGVRHGGLGSSAALQTAVAIAINSLMGNKIPRADLIKFLAQNYGEESDIPGYLIPMISIGGASAAMTSVNNVTIVGGEAEIWKEYDLSDDYSVVMVTPKIVNNKQISNSLDIELYNRGREIFSKIGRDWGDIKENLLKNKIITGLNNNDPSHLFNLLTMYTLGAYGDIPQYYKNRWLQYTPSFDKFIYNIFNDCFDSTSIKESSVFVSSGGPSIFIVTRDSKEIIKKLKKYRIFSVKRLDLYKGGPQIMLK